MLSNNGDKYFRCPCKSCEDYSNFKNPRRVQGVGLVIYQQISQNQLKSNTEHMNDTTTDEIFILRNTKDKKVTVSCISTQEMRNINCPRCKYIIECAKKRMLVKVQNDENTILGVCDHCHDKSISQISCYECEDIAKKIISSINNDRSDATEKNLNTWLANVKKLLKRSNINNERAENNAQCVVDPQLHSNNSPETTDTLDPGEIHSQIKIRSKPTTFRANDHKYISKPKPDTNIMYKTRSFESYLSRLENTTVYKNSPLESEKQYGIKLDSTISSSARDKVYMHKPVHRTLPNHNYLSDNAYALGRHTTSPGGVRDYNTIDKKNIAESDRRKLLSIEDSYHLANRNFGPEPGTRTKADMEDYDSSNWQHQKDLIMSDNDYNQSQKTNLKENTRDIKKFENLGGKKDLKSKATKTVKVTLRNTSLLMSSLHRARSATSIQDLREASLSTDVFKSTTDLYSGHKNKIRSKSHDYLERLVPLNVSRTITSKKIKNIDIPLGHYTPDKKKTPEEVLSSPILHQPEILLRKDFSYQFPKDIILKKGPKRLPTSAELIKDTQDMLNERDEQKKQAVEIKRIRKLLEEEIKNKARDEKRRLQEGKRKEEEERKRIEDKAKKKDEENWRKFEEEQRIEVKNKIQTNLKLSKKESQKSREDKEQLKTEREKAKEETREKSKSEKLDKKEAKADHPAEKLKKQKEREIQLKILKDEKQRENEEKELLKKEKKEQLNAEKYQKQREKEEEKNKQNERISVQPSNKDKEMSNLKLKNQKGESAKIQIKQNKELIKVEDIKQVYDESNVRDETLKRKKETQIETYARDEGNRKDKEEIEALGKVHGMVAKTDIQSEIVEKNIKVDKINKSPMINELDIKQIKVRKPSYDDLIIKLVRLKQNELREKLKQKQIPMIDIPMVAREHKKHKYTKTSKCLMCVDSEFELEVENVLFKTDKPKDTADIIIGDKIFKNIPLSVNKEERAIVVPSDFKTTFQVESPKMIINEPDLVGREKPELNLPIISVPAKSQKLAEQEAPKGIIRYALSDRTFIEKGWTTLPTEKVVRKMNVYRMRPAHPEFDWFEHHKKKKLMLYDTGEKLADFEAVDRSRIYYKNGRLALDYYDAEETNAQQRFVVFSSGELDERGRSHPITILATFDYLGNGIVFDHSGKIRLKYNQTEGVVLDRNIGPVSHWKWHTLNDPPVLQKDMIDTQMSHKDPEIVKMGGLSNDKSRPDNEEMLAIEFDNFIKEKSKKLTQTFKPFQIKMKALKINEHFSLKILDQATIYLIFRDGTTNIKMNIGMILDHKEIVDTDTAEVGEVSNNLERFPARTESLAGLQRSVAYAQRFERARLERERRLRPPELCASADLLTAASSRPLRLPLKTAASSSTTVAAAVGYCKCSRKPCSTNVYYDTRLI